MSRTEIIAGVVLEEVALSIDELARACCVETVWVVERVQEGLLQTRAEQPEWRFASAELQRARRLAAIERDFDANPEAAALVVDLIEEVARLRARLRAAGLG